MSEFLNEIYKTGDTAPESGVYQLAGEDPDGNERRNLGRVIRAEQGEELPGHPDTDAEAEWRLIRIAADEQQLEALY
jgi:hypothetical protein